MIKVIAITGIPGTGKTYLAKKIAKHFNYQYINVKKLLKKNNLLINYDFKAKTYNVDVKKCNNVDVDIVKIDETMCRDEELSYDVIVQDYDLSTGIGVSLFQTGIVRYPWYIAIWQGIKMSFIWLVTIVMAFAMLIKNLIVGAPTGVEVAGPVGIAVMTGQFARMGFIYVMQFTALLSLNLAIINFVPFPALDGGRVLFLIIEKIKGKPVNQKWENLAHNIGFILLMVLILFVTFKDVGQYGGRMIDVIRGIVGL